MQIEMKVTDARLRPGGEWEMKRATNGSTGHGTPA